MNVFDQFALPSRAQRRTHARADRVASHTLHRLYKARTQLRQALLTREQDTLNHAKVCALQRDIDLLTGTLLTEAADASHDALLRRAARLLHDCEALLAPGGQRVGAGLEL